jgi:hypothetical protein
VTIKLGAQHRIIGGRSKMFIGKRRIEERRIRSHILELLIVDRVSRKPQEKTSVIERERARTPGTERKVAKWEARRIKHVHQDKSCRTRDLSPLKMSIGFCKRRMSWPRSWSPHAEPRERMERSSRQAWYGFLSGTSPRSRSFTAIPLVLARFFRPGLTGTPTSPTATRIRLPTSYAGEAVPGTIPPRPQKASLLATSSRSTATMNTRST